MAELVTLLTLHPEADRAAVAEALREALGGKALIAPVLPGGRNAGDLLVRLSLGAEQIHIPPLRSLRVAVEPVETAYREAAAPDFSIRALDFTRSLLETNGRGGHDHLPPTLDTAITLADGAVFEIVAGEGDPLGSPVHRTALFHAFRNPTPDRLAQFERETLAMPRRLPFIQGWALGRVTQGWGRFPWSYVWEQGYDRLTDLTVRYMRHPCHWGQVDRWFDPEHPDWLIDPGVCHAFCRQAPDIPEEPA